MQKASLILVIILTLGISGCATSNSQNIDVKYIEDPVDVSSFEYLDTSKSSFVRAAWYDSQDGDLILKLDDTSYQYCDVPTSRWSEFKKADSFGKYYNSNIKGSYSCS